MLRIFHLYGLHSQEKGIAAAYRVEVAKMTAAPLVGKVGVKAGGVSNAIRAVLLVF